MVTNLYWSEQCKISVVCLVPEWSVAHACQTITTAAATQTFSSIPPRCIGSDRDCFPVLFRPNPECLCSSYQNRARNQLLQSLSCRAMPQLRQLVASIAPQKFELNYSAVHVRFVVNKVTMGQVLLKVHRVFLTFITPTMLHSLIYHLEVVQWAHLWAMYQGTSHSPQQE
jgi:hypothetical protein